MEKIVYEMLGEMRGEPGLNCQRPLELLNRQIHLPFFEKRLPAVMVEACSPFSRQRVLAGETRIKWIILQGLLVGETGLLPIPGG